VDGENDFVCLGPDSAAKFGASGHFTVSFMFTKFNCHVPGHYAVLRCIRSGGICCRCRYLVLVPRR
jgi:hypothetical protein